MDSIRMLKKWIRQKNAGGRLAFTGLVFWTISLPFAMAQPVRFTSVFLFVILAGFLLHAFASGFDIFRVSIRQVKLILPLILMALLPLVHFLPDGGNARELILGAPLFFIPWMVFYLKDLFPSPMPRVLFLCLLISWSVLLLFLVSEGPVLVWNSVRSDREIPDLFLLARPQLGLLSGLIFFLLIHFIKVLKKPVFLIPLLLIFTGLLYWIMAKIAILAFLFSLLLYVIFQLRKQAMMLFPILAVLIASLITGVWWLAHSGLAAEAFSRDGLSFQKYPKAMVNSINSRIVLWRAGFDVLLEDGQILTGISSDQLEVRLKTATARYNQYLAGQNLNPHNQPLYMLLHYGLPGILVLLLFWFRLFERSRGKPALLSLLVFLLICSQTEIYLDREFGTQLFMLIFLLTGIREENNKKMINPEA